MLSDFIPVPSIGSYYKKEDGQIIIVKYYLPEEPGQEETIGYAYTSNLSDEKETLQAEWNSWNLIALSSEDMDKHGEGKDKPVNDGDNKPEDVDGDDEPNDQGTSKKEPSHEEPHVGGSTSEPFHKSHGIGLDPKLQELEDFLKKGPEINAQFFPFNHKVESNDVEENDIIEGYNKTLKEIDDLREEGKKRVNKWSINEFLWTCGGLDKNLLRMFPTDWAKKAGMGGTILGTSILATFSMGFAAYTVASIGENENSHIPLLVAIVAGIIWGLVIFNLDRYLVNSMYSDGEPTISMREFKSGLPRIIIAVFLGIVISTPLEMKIFDGKINEMLDTEKEELLAHNKTTDLNDFNEECKRLHDQYENAYKEYTILLKCIVAEEQGLLYDRSTGEILKDANGKPQKNSRGPGAGTEYKNLKNKEQTYKEKADTLQNVYNKYKSGEDSIIAKSEDRTNDEFKDQQGFSRRLEALLKVTSLFKEKHDTNGKPIYEKNSKGEYTDTVATEFNSLWMVRFLIMLMFIIFEVLPVFNKMMQEDGKYDKMIDLESDTMDKLARAKEANNINILRSGRLSRYKSYILGKKVKEFEDDNLEDNIGFTKKEPLREDKNTVDNNNQEIFNEAQALAKAYVFSEMRKIFGDISPTRSQTTSQEPINNSSVNVDPTLGAKTIPS